MSDTTMPNTDALRDALRDVIESISFPYYGSDDGGYYCIFCGDLQGYRSDKCADCDNLDCPGVKANLLLKAMEVLRHDD